MKRKYPSARLISDMGISISTIHICCTLTSGAAKRNYRPHASPIGGSISAIHVVSAMYSGLSRLRAGLTGALGSLAAVGPQLERVGGVAAHHQRAEGARAGVPHAAALAPHPDHRVAAQVRTRVRQVRWSWGTHTQTDIQIYSQSVGMQTHVHLFSGSIQAHTFQIV